MKNKVIYGLVSALWYLLSLLPFWVHYLLSDFVCLVLYRLIGYRVKVVRGNLTSSFPEKSEAEIREIEQKFYHRLCDYFVEAVKMKTMSEQQMRRHMVFKGTELVNECVASGQSCAVYLGHSFNWEWITSLPLWVSDKAQCGQLYHALENEAFDKLFLRLRERWGAECIPLVDILRKTESGYDFYEVKNAPEVRPQFVKDAGFQYYIITRCKLQIGRIFIVIHGQDETDPFVPVDVTEEAKSYYNWINDHIWDLNRMQKQPEEITVEPGEQCSDPYDCWYYGYCHGESPMDDQYRITD